MNILIRHHSHVHMLTRAVWLRLPYPPNSTSISKNAIQNSTFATTVRNLLFFYWIFNVIEERNTSLGVLHVTWSLRQRMFCCIISVHIVHLLRRGRNLRVSMGGVQKDTQRYELVEWGVDCSYLL